MAGSAGQRLLAVAQRNAIESGPVQDRVAQRHGVGRQLCARADGDAARVGVGCKHVERGTAADPESAALPDGVAMSAAMNAKGPTA